MKLDKGEFNGSAVLAEQKATGVTRKVAGFVVTGRGIARAGYPVTAGEKTVGQVTTGSFAPTLGKNLGLALIETAFSKPGQIVDIEIRGKKVPAEIIAKPFYKREGK